MCIEFLRIEGEPHPMELVSKSIHTYITNNEPTKDGLLDWLSDERDAGKIQKCGCNDSEFEFIKTETGYIVYMSASGFLGARWEIVISNVIPNGYSYRVPVSSEEEGYDDITYNEYMI